MVYSINFNLFTQQRIQLEWRKSFFFKMIDIKPVCILIEYKMNILAFRIIGITFEYPLEYGTIIGLGIPDGSERKHKQDGNQ